MLTEGLQLEDCNERMQAFKEVEAGMVMWGITCFMRAFEMQTGLPWGRTGVSEEFLHQD